MARKLSRRRYSEATKYLKELITDVKQPTRIRLRAVDSLLGIYAADDRHADRTAPKTPKAEAEPGDVNDTHESATLNAPGSAEREAREFLRRMEGRIDA